jgi:hypothetical protein
MRSPTDEPRRYRGVLLGLVPAAGMLAIVAVLATRHGAEIELPVRRSAAAVDAPVAPLPRMAVSTPPPKPAPDSVIAEKTMEARVRTTYENYRTAVATGNDQLRKVLEPVLLRDRDLALKMARAELAQATEPLDQQIARKMVEALRN